MLARKRAGRVGLGFPNSWRVACVSALIGFHSAIGWSTSGSVAVGTNAFERKVSGKMMRKPSCCTVSTVGATSPRKTPTHAIAYVKKTISATANRKSATEEWTRHPTTRPLSISTTRIPSV